MSTHHLPHSWPSAEEVDAVRPEAFLDVMDGAAVTELHEGSTRPEMASGHTAETMEKAWAIDPTDLVRAFLLIPPEAEPGTVFA